jgi:hypothetical protein
MKYFLIVLSLFIGIQSFGQSSQKKYKYIIVPLQYGFNSEPNQYQLNILTRVMLQSEGFEVYMSEGEEIPDYVDNNQCSFLKANVKKDKGLFQTNLRFQLINCYGKVIYESAGSSRKKDYGDAYKEALGHAMTVFQSESSKFLKLDNGEEDTSEVLVEEIKVTPKSFEELATIYMLNNTQYWMLKSDKNFVIYSDKGETVFATLSYADKGTYSYDSESIDGAAYFTPEGNLVVEYLAKKKDAVQELMFERQ